MKLLIVVGLLFVGLSSYGQYSIGGGVSTLFQFGNNKPFAGMHLVAEFPRNNEVTFYVRANYLFKQNLNQPVQELDPTYPDVLAYGKESSTSPAQIIVPLNSIESLNYFMVDGGTRYYLINGYDEGFALYGGTNIGVVINSVNYGFQLENYDTTNYTMYGFDEQIKSSKGKGTVLSLAVGVSGGVKYTSPGRGTFYFDFNPALQVFSLPSNPEIFERSSMLRSVLFNFNIGYRREFY